MLNLEHSTIVEQSQKTQLRSKIAIGIAVTLLTGYSSASQSSSFNISQSSKTKITWHEQRARTKKRSSLGNGGIQIMWMREET